YDPINGYISINVVSIAVENSNSFWVTMLDRNGNGIFPYDRDEVMVSHFDSKCNFITTPKFHEPIMGVSTDFGEYYSNLYPTHSVFFNGYLYVCGYASNSTTIYPNTPDVGDCDKVGMLLKLDINSSTGVSVASSLFWNTTCSVPKDYDMALRIKSDPSSGSLIMTGARNSAITGESETLLMSVNPNTLSVNIQNGLLHTFSSPSPASHGVYGIDVNIDNTGGCVVLANKFDGMVATTWAVIGTDNTLQANPTINSMLLNSNSSASWANGFAGDAVYGQQTATYGSTSIPPGFQPLGGSNIDPFLDLTSFAYSVTRGMLSFSGDHKIQLSTYGTNTYFGIAGLDNITRLYTFGAYSSKYYLLSPVYLSNLNAKCIVTNSIGDEIQCNTTFLDAPSTFNGYQVFNENNNFSLVTVNFFVNTPFLITGDNPGNPCTVTDCTSGQYKLPNSYTNISSSTIVANLDKGDIKISPNPSIDKATIEFGNTSNENVTLEIVDAFGRVIHNSKNFYSKGLQHIDINTSEFIPGVYYVNLKTDTKLFTKKLSVIR
ncbi:MAG: T9SS type A sorting domain-containing protein, partial [Flavipsychrobacter sp.]